MTRNNLFLIDLNDARLIWHIRRVFATLKMVIEGSESKETTLNELRKIGRQHKRHNLTPNDFKVLFLLF